MSKRVTTDAEIRRRVARGAARLDMAYGGKWREIFSAGHQPDFENFEQCVLGRMQGSYHGGVMLLFPDPLGTRDGLRSTWQRRQAVDHGFMRGPKDDDDYYDRLLEAWLPELQKRGIGP